jgi:trk system potassium uptake protein TrkH
MEWFTTHCRAQADTDNEALTIVALAFVLSPLLMTLPFMGSGLTFCNALFEAISAITTTGLSMTTDPVHMPPSFLFARSWMQWYGGLGIVVLSVAMVIGHSVPVAAGFGPQ